MRVSQIIFKAEGARVKHFESHGALRLNISHECGLDLRPFIYYAIFYIIEEIILAQNVMTAM